MKKILLNESERKAAILDREKAIVENFAKTFNKIKRIDENEVKPISESLLAIGGAVVLAGIVAKAVGTIKNNMLAKRFEKTGEKEEVKGPKGGNLIMYGYKDKKDGKHYWGFDFQETRGDAGHNEINTMLFNDDTAASVKNYIVKDGSGQRPTGEEGAEGHYDDYFGPHKSDVRIYRGTNENEVAGMETKELEKKAFDFANSPEMGQLVDKILAKSKPEDLQKIKTALGSVSESMMYESDFSSFLNIAHKAQSTLSEDNSAGNLQNSVGKALQKFGVANIMSMGMLPAVVSIAVDYLGGPNLLQAVGNALGTGGGGTAALSVVASLIGGALLWRLGKAVSGEKVTGDTPLFQ